MSTLAAAARPAKTARQLKKLKEIRKIRGAIRWHERARAKHHKKVADRFNDKQVYKRRDEWKRNQVTRYIKEAKKNLKEDYQLGPLRPNRAVGVEASTYGLTGPYHMRRPDIPIDTQRRKNEGREAKGLNPVYPIVVGDHRYFPIVAGDRVMVMKGTDQGKIGVVDRVIEESQDYIIKDINMQYVDPTMLNIPDDEQGKIQQSVPLALEDIRLVHPYRITSKDKNGEIVHTYTDVVVDEIVMKRHTTGVDPFTELDYGKHEFPEEHRFDPTTGWPIFHRYIAGTHRRIQWPWEAPVEFTDTGKPTETIQEEPTESNESVLGRLKSAPRRALQFFSKLRKRDKETVPEETKKPEKTLVQQEHERVMKYNEQVENMPELPRGVPGKDRLPGEYNSDSNPDDYEGDVIPDYQSTFGSTLMSPPYPRKAGSEIYAYAKEAKKAEADEKRNWYEDAKNVSPEERAERKAKKAERLKKQGVPDSMKTPLQLRWEVERKKKLETAETTKVDREALMIAVGMHIQAKRAPKATTKSGRYAIRQSVAELD